MRKTFILVVLGLMILSSCSRLPTPHPDVKTLVPQVLVTPATDPAAPARAHLAGGLALPEEQIVLMSMEPVIWPDGCLGIYTPDAACTEALVPGYRLVFEAQNQRYEYHCDQDGSYYKGLPAQPAIGRPQLIWQSAGQPCLRAHFTTSGAAVGACTGSLAVMLYPGPQRGEQLAGLLGLFAPVSSETTAGSIDFSGAGDRPAGAAELRSLAEWAAGVAAELPNAPDAASGLLLSWQRSGGIAGFCDVLYVYRSGLAQVGSCRSDPPEFAPGLLRLGEDDLAVLYNWTDRLAPINIIQTDGAVADSMTITLTIFGQGSEQPSEDEKSTDLLFAGDLFARLSRP